MSFPTYVDPIPLPPPVTTGSGIQSYTDPLGDVWIAANGVANGAWKRATNACKAKNWPNANFSLNPQATYNVIPLNSGNTVNDPYGLMATNNRFTIPFYGWWRVHGAMTTAGQASAARIICAVYRSGGEAIRGNDIWYLANQTTTTIVSDTVVLNAGDYLELRGYSSIAGVTAYGASPNLTFFTVVYDGTG